MSSNADLIAAAADWTADGVAQHATSALDTIHRLRTALEAAERERDDAPVVTDPVVEYVRNGVCLLCGDGVLNSGEHVDPERHEAEVERITSGAKAEPVAYELWQSGGFGLVRVCSPAAAEVHRRDDRYTLVPLYRHAPAMDTITSGGASVPSADASWAAGSLGHAEADTCQGCTEGSATAEYCSACGLPTAADVPGSSDAR